MYGTTARTAAEPAAPASAAAPAVLLALVTAAGAPVTLSACASAAVSSPPRAVEAAPAPAPPVCSDAAPDACFDLVQVQLAEYRTPSHPSHGAPEIARRAAATLVGLCDRNIAEACLQLATEYDELFAGAVAPPPPRIAFQRRACAAGLDACGPTDSLAAGPSLAALSLAQFQACSSMRGRERFPGPRLLLEAPAYRDAQHWSALGDLMATKSLCLDSYVVSSTRQMTKARPEERASLRQARTASVLRIDEARAKAAQAYGQAAAFRDYERADRVLYEQGVVLLAARRDAEAQKAFDRLRAEHPGSPAIADADLALADRAFDDGDFAGARTLYERTESGPPSTAGATARYRRAWCELALGRTGEALRVLTSVIAASELRTPEVDPRQQRALASAARRDLVRVYAQAGDARAVEAGPLFRRIGGDHAQSMLRDLADSYRKQGRTADAEQVLSGADLAPPGAHP